MFADLLPASVVCIETDGDNPGAEPMGAEADLVARAPESRRREFGTARACARRALARFGVAPAPLLAGPHREPLWPAGFTGSITHCDAYRAAAVARCRDVRTLGIDAEPHDALPGDVLALVARPEERRWLAQAPAGTHWDRLLFSAKESVYKAWFPLGRGWLGFEDASVEIDVARGTFQARLLPARRDGRVPDGFVGRFSVRDDRILTAIALET